MKMGDFMIFDIPTIETERLILRPLSINNAETEAQLLKQRFSE